MKARINLIYAHAINDVIGNLNGLPWQIPEDLARFKKLTMGCPVIMGRVTWESIPEDYRPLPGRTNIVVTRNADWSCAGAHPASSLSDAIEKCHDAKEIWVIGGAEILALAEPLASRAEVTEIKMSFEGDTIVPPLGTHWIEQCRVQRETKSGMPYDYVTYLKNS